MRQAAPLAPGGAAPGRARPGTTDLHPAGSPRLAPGGTVVPLVATGSGGTPPPLTPEPEPLRPPWCLRSARPWLHPAGRAGQSRKSAGRRSRSAGREAPARDRARGRSGGAAEGRQPRRGTRPAPTRPHAPPRHPAGGHPEISERAKNSFSSLTIEPPSRCIVSGTLRMLMRCGYRPDRTFENRQRNALRPGRGRCGARLRSRAGPPAGLHQHHAAFSAYARRSLFN